LGIFVFFVDSSIAMLKGLRASTFYKQLRVWDLDGVYHAEILRELPELIAGRLLARAVSLGEPLLAGSIYWKLSENILDG
jgi:hypothetical protein